MALVGLPGGGNLEGFSIGKTTVLDFFFPFLSTLFFTIYIKKVRFFYPKVIEPEILEQNDLTTDVPKQITTKVELTKEKLKRAEDSTSI